jgi:hypothetical protein
MTSWLEQAQQGKKRQVVAYSPGRSLAPAPPQRQAAAPARLPATPLQQALARANSSPAAQERAQKKAEKQAKDEAWDKTPMWGKGLGIVFGNPVSRAVMNGLDTLAIPRRLGQALWSEAYAAAPDAAHPFFGLLGTRVDEEKVKNDDRGIWERARDPEYGFGQFAEPLSEDDKGFGWVANRAQGFTGDTVMDPTTYLTAGAAKIVGGAAEGTTAFKAAIEAGKSVDEAAEIGRAARVAAGVKASPLLPNRGARVAELGELAVMNPELAAAHTDELARVAQRGYSAAESPVVREALGLAEPQVRFAGMPIPGSQRIAAPIGKAGGAVRGALNSNKYAYGLARGSKGMEQPLRELVGDLSGQGDTFRNLTAVGLHGILPEGRSVEARGNRELGVVYRKYLKGLSRAEQEELVYQAETAADPNVLNQLAGNVASIYKDVSGRDIDPFLKSGDTYVPHVLTVKARRWMAETEEGKEFARKAGYTTDDLLEGSGYLEKSRKLVKNREGTEQVIKVGNREMKFTDATIRDLNAAFKESGTDLGFDLYESRPGIMMEAYISSLAKGAGRDRAIARLADSPNPLVKQVGGELEAERLAFQKALDAQDVTYNAVRDATDEGIVPAMGPHQPLPESDWLEPVVGTDATKKKVEVLTGADTKARLKEHNQGTSEQRKGLIDDTTKGVEELRTQAEAEAKAALPAESSKVLSARADKATRELNKMTSDTAKAAAQKDLKGMARIVARGRAEAAKLERMINRAVGPGEKRISAADRKLAKEALERYQGAERRAFALLQDKEPLHNAIAAELEGIDRPVVQLEEELRAAMAAATPPYPKEVVQKAGRLAGTDATVTEAQMRRAAGIVEDAEEAVLEGVPPVYSAEELAEAKTLLRTSEGHTVEDMIDAARIMEGHNKFLEAYNNKINPIKEKLRRARGVREGEALQTTDIDLRPTPDDVDRPVSIARARRMAAEPEVLGDYVKRAVEERKAPYPGPSQTIIQKRKMINGGGPGTMRYEHNQKIAELLWRRSKATGEAKKAWNESIERIKLNDQEIQGLRGTIDATKEQLAAARAQEEVVAKMLKEAKVFNAPTSTKNMTLVEVKKMLKPLKDITRQNSTMSDDVLNKTELLLHDAATRGLAIADRDLTASQVQNLINEAGTGKLADVAIAGVNDAWKMLHSGTLKEGDYIVDAELHKMMQNLYQMSTEPGLFGRTFNAMTNLFKTYATLSPGFHVRNAMSAIFMNTSDGVPLKVQYEAAGLWKKFAAEGETWLRNQPQEIRDAFTVAASTGAGGRFAESGVAQELANEGTRAGRTYNKLASNRVTKASQRAGERVEGSVRLGPALDSIRRGDSLQAATQRVKRLHFDYADVSKMDESAKRLIPFWTFMSRNLPLQISQMWSKPRLYQQYSNLVRNFSSDDPEFTPDYWKGSGAFNTGLKVPHIPQVGPMPAVGAKIINQAEGLPIFGAPDLGFTRVGSDVQDLEDALSGKNVGGLFSSFNPWLTAPAEYYARKDFFTGQEFPEGEGFEEPEGWWAPVIKLVARATGNYDESLGGVDPRMMNALSAVIPPISRAERLTPQLTGGDEADMQRQPEAIARFLGFPLRTLTPKQQENEALRRYYDEQDALRQKAG